MGNKLLRTLEKTTWLLSGLVLLVFLIRLFGDLAYIYVPFIAAGALALYTVYDVNRSKARLKAAPEWDDFVVKHRAKGIKKVYQRDTREMHYREGRRKHMEARLSGRR